MKKSDNEAADFVFKNLHCDYCHERASNKVHVSDRSITLPDNSYVSFASDHAMQRAATYNAEVIRY